MSLSAWKRELRDKVDNGWGDPDTPDCPKCGARMKFHGHDKNGDFEYGEGYWKCKNCGYQIYEDEF